MKLIKYQMLQTTIIDGAEQPQSEENMSSVTGPYSAENEEAAKREAYKGEYEIFENGIPEPLAQPTLLDRLEAQLAYTAMITDTLI